MRCFVVCLAGTLTVLLKSGQGEAHDLRKRVTAGRRLEPNEMEEASFLISLKYHKPSSITDLSGIPHACQGTLVDRQWVVTAAHCFSCKTFMGIDKLEDWTVVAGEYDQNGTEGREQIRQISQVFKPRNFRMKLFYLRGLDDKFYNAAPDVALIKVDRPFELNDYVSTLSYDASCVMEGDACTLYGWGAIKTFGATQRFPNKAEMRMGTQDDCRTTYEDISPEYIEGPLVCTQGSAPNDEGLVADGCAGDSGGPLVCTCQNQAHGVLAGIVSAGFVCGVRGFPGLYTNVAAPEVFGFIRDTIQENK